MHLQNCILLVWDEAYWPGDKQMEGVLRALITEVRLPVEVKYQNLFETHNCVHVLIFSNNDWVVPMATDARRFFVLDVPDTHSGDSAYWDALGYELEHGGPAAMLGELPYDCNIKYFNPRQVPDTPAGREQKRLTLDTIRSYLIVVLDRGYVYQPSTGSRACSSGIRLRRGSFGGTATCSGATKTTVTSARTASSCSPH